MLVTVYIYILYCSIWSSPVEKSGYFSHGNQMKWQVLMNLKYWCFPWSFASCSASACCNALAPRKDSSFSSHPKDLVLYWDTKFYPETNKSLREKRSLSHLRLQPMNQVQHHHTPSYSRLDVQSFFPVSSVGNSYIS